MVDADTAPSAERPPRRRRRALSSDAWLLLVCALVLLLSVVLDPSAEAVRLGDWTLPPLCVFKNTLGVECWGCGLTRSFTFMGHGQPGAAFELHRLGPVLFVVVLAQLPLRAWRLWKARQPPGPRPPHGYPPQ